MPISAPFLAFAVDETHRSAEQHWRRHGVLPTKVLLFSPEGVPEMVAIPSKAGNSEAERFIAEHARGIRARAVVLTSLASTSMPSTGRRALEHLTLSDLPQPSDDPLRQNVIFTIGCWPVGGIATTHVSVIDSSSNGGSALEEAMELRPVTLAASEGLVAWLSALLPTEADRP